MTTGAVDGRSTDYDAVVLAGGAGRRLGGVDKAALDLGGTSLLDRVLAALADTATVVVVGPRRATGRPVEWAREDPPGSGPVAGLRVGLPLTHAPWVAVLAADLPFVTAGHLVTLRQAAEPTDGALLVDDAGREQYLVGLWRSAALHAALTSYDGTSLRGLVERVAHASVPAPVEQAPPWYDVDTQADLDAARGWA